MKFASEKHGAAVDVHDDVVRFIKKQAAKARTKETGGILIGRYSDDLSIAFVLKASAAPSDSRSGSTWFARGIANLDTMLRLAWQKRLHYLGEWHFHPGGAPTASPGDRVQMHKIANDAKMQCENPVLIIIGDILKVTSLSAYLQDRGEFISLPEVAEEPST